MNFWLGTHQIAWLARTDVPLMVSRRRIADYKTLPRARGPIFRDSSGFTKLALDGSWDDLPAALFVAEARMHSQEIGNVVSFAPRDWMCEPTILRKTGLTITEHQRRTVVDYCDLIQRAPELPWVPVLQGWAMADYLRCVEMYDRAGVDLRAVPLVGVGTICRRQGTQEAVEILRVLASQGLRLHAFGFKQQGLANAANILASADSMAWSYAARRRPPLPGCTTHKNCANCMRYALDWRERVLALHNRQQDALYQMSFAA